ncbi:SH3 domain-containing protein 19-like [Lycodopsis pacificus]
MTIKTPVPPRKPAELPVKEELEILLNKRSRPSVLTRDNSIHEEDTPPVPPVKPFKEPLQPNLNINNHNSTARVTENVYVDSPSIKPVDGNGGSSPRPSMTRRPTTIRVPSKTSSSVCSAHTEGPGELGLRAGDVVTMVEQVDSEWYRGTCRGSSGFFPANYVKVLSNSPKPLPEWKARPPSATVSGPRCVARFDFEGENSSELAFSEGDVIQLKALVGQDWARGQIAASTGIFPLNFVEVIEDLPPAPSQQKTQSIRIALPGMVAPPSTHPEAAKPAQASQPAVEWGVALYDYDGNSDGDLSFQQGDRILISRHVDAEWSCGRLNGTEGVFPRAFVESSTAGQQPNNQQSGAAAGSRGKAMFDYPSQCDEELSLQVGDIITGLEPVDEEWFLGDLRGKRALVPKNYVQVLG